MIKETDLFPLPKGRGFQEKKVRGSSVWPMKVNPHVGRAKPKPTKFKPPMSFKAFFFIFKSSIQSPQGFHARADTLKFPSKPSRIERNLNPPSQRK